MPEYEMQKKELLFCFGILAIGLMFFVGCGADSQEEIVPEKNRVVVHTYDSYRKPVDVSFQSVPQRVIANRLNTVETLIALGVEDHIIAANMQNTDWGKPYDLQFAEKGKKLKAVTYRDLTLEETLMFQPDCIIGWKSTFQSKTLGTTDFWKRRHVNTYIQATSNLVKPYAGIDDECQFITDMGTIFDRSGKANQLVAEIRGKVADVQKRVRTRSHPNVMVIEFQGQTISSYGAEWLVGDMVQKLGGHLLTKSGRISYEDLLVLNPDVIFVVYFNSDLAPRMQFLMQDPRFHSLKAVQNQRVYPLRLDYMYTTAVRTVEGLQMLTDGLYPDLAGKP